MDRESYTSLNNTRTTSSLTFSVHEGGRWMHAGLPQSPGDQDERLLTSVYRNQTYSQIQSLQIPSPPKDRHWCVNSGLHVLNRADVITSLAVHRKLTGWKDEHMSRGFPVFKSGTMMEVVKSSGVVILLRIRWKSCSRHLCRFLLPNLWTSLSMPQPQLLSRCIVTSKSSGLDQYPVWSCSSLVVETGLLFMLLQNVCRKQLPWLSHLLPILHLGEVILLLCSFAHMCHTSMQVKAFLSHLEHAPPLNPVIPLCYYIFFQLSV